MKNTLYKMAVAYNLVCIFLLLDFSTGASLLSLFNGLLYLLFALPFVAIVLLITAPSSLSAGSKILKIVSGFGQIVGALGVAAPFVLSLLCPLLFSTTDATGCADSFIIFGLLVIPSGLLFIVSFTILLVVNRSAWRERIFTLAYLISLLILFLMIAGIAAVPFVQQKAQYDNKQQEQQTPTATRFVCQNGNALEIMPGHYSHDQSPGSEAIFERSGTGLKTLGFVDDQAGTFTWLEFGYVKNNYTDGLIDRYKNEIQTCKNYNGKTIDELYTEVLPSSFYR